MSAHENENPVFGLDSVPFVTASYDDAAKLWAAGKEQFSKALEEQNLVLVYSVPWPPQGFYFKRK